LQRLAHHGDTEVSDEGTHEAPRVFMGLPAEHRKVLIRRERIEDFVDAAVEAVVDPDDVRLIVPAASCAWCDVMA